ncbi:MAG: hypothetical protein NC311_15835 [Muribaculaceae bacterium]|nr:hypothetical protein [Muribaculaceae bacterium]
MIDIHSHILPNMDDGSRGVEESLALLRLSAAQGIACVAATPHFYAEDNSPAEFLKRRAASAAKLRAHWEPGLPRLLLGAEVCCFEGMSRVSELDALRIEGTELLLLEMPFRPWTDRLVREVLAIQDRSGVTVVLAHVERYLPGQTDAWDILTDAGVLTQCNANFFLRWRTRRKAMRLLNQGRIHFLGSDCHNMAARPPRLGNALEAIGAGAGEMLEENIREFFPAWEDT